LSRRIVLLDIFVSYNYLEDIEFSRRHFVSKNCFIGYFVSKNCLRDICLKELFYWIYRIVLWIYRIVLLDI